MRYYHIVYFHSTVLDVYYLHSWKQTMYLYTLKVHCNIDVTYVEHSCEIDEVLSYCLLSLYSTRCLLLTLMKANDVFVHIKSSL